MSEKSWLFTTRSNRKDFEMNKKQENSESVRRQLLALGQMTQDEMIEKWTDLFGSQPPQYAAYLCGNGWRIGFRNFSMADFRRC